MTNACAVGLIGTKGDEFVLANTDGAWGELINADGLSLWEVLQGETISGYIGSYTTGGGIIRVYNPNTGRVEIMALLDIITEEVFHEFDHEFTVKNGDLLQVFTMAVA
jgi:hypothetical protein